EREGTGSARFLCVAPAVLNSLCRPAGLEVTENRHICAGTTFTKFLCVALAVLELTLYTWLASNSQGSTCFYLPSAGIKGMHHH
ncbi:hypothetical protein LEMLEM_LOCUS14770, partial [Lemmus lemmus]